MVQPRTGARHRAGHSTRVQQTGWSGTEKVSAVTRNHQNVYIPETGIKETFRVQANGREVRETKSKASEGFKGRVGHRDRGNPRAKERVSVQTFCGPEMGREPLGSQATVNVFQNICSHLH